MRSLGECVSPDESIGDNKGVALEGKRSCDRG